MAIRSPDATSIFDGIVPSSSVMIALTHSHLPAVLTMRDHHHISEPCSFHDLRGDLVWLVPAAIVKFLRRPVVNDCAIRDHPGLPSRVCAVGAGEYPASTALDRRRVPARGRDGSGHTGGEERSDPRMALQERRVTERAWRSDHPDPTPAAPDTRLMVPPLTACRPGADASRSPPRDGVRPRSRCG